MQLGQPRERETVRMNRAYGSHYIRTYGKFVANTLSRSTSHWKLRDFKYSFEKRPCITLYSDNSFQQYRFKCVKSLRRMVIGFCFVRVNTSVRLRLAAISITIIDVTRRTVNKRRNHICIHRPYWRSSWHIKLRLFYEIV